MDEITFPSRIMSRFVETLSEEMGQGTLSEVLSNAGLPQEWAVPANFSAKDDVRAAQV